MVQDAFSSEANKANAFIFSDEQKERMHTVLSEQLKLPADMQETLINHF